MSSTATCIMAHLQPALNARSEQVAICRYCCLIQPAVPVAGHKPAAACPLAARPSCAHRLVPMGHRRCPSMRRLPWRSTRYGLRREAQVLTHGAGSGSHRVAGAHPLRGRRLSAPAPWVAVHAHAHAGSTVAAGARRPEAAAAPHRQHAATCKTTHPCQSLQACAMAPVQGDTL